MRYAPAENLLRLARHLAATRCGLTLDEMATELQVGRRTAERLRDSLQAMFPELDYQDDESRIRRWRLPATALTGMTTISVESVAAVEMSARECDQRGETDRARLLREAVTSLRLAMKPDALRRAEPDLFALMEAEGTAMRPGPRVIMADGVLSVLRRAILGMQLIVARYRSTPDGEPSTRILCPYGILYGGRGWLVAHQEDKADLRLWRLDRLESVDLLDRNFSRREDFSLSQFAARSFGVFQEPPQEVVLRFAQSAAIDAQAWQFHPTQTKHRESDGTLTVRFRAGGRHEIANHLLTWGEAVCVVEPRDLGAHIAELSARISKHHAIHSGSLCLSVRGIDAMARWSVTVRYVTATGSPNTMSVSVEAMSERTAMTLAENQVKAKPLVRSASTVAIRKISK